jgi:hypothetical protein
MEKKSKIAALEGSRKELKIGVQKNRYQVRKGRTVFLGARFMDDEAPLD